MGNSADIIIPEPLDGAGIERLREKYTLTVDKKLWKNGHKLAHQLCKARAIIVRNQTLITDGLLEDCPNLQVIGRAGIGLDNIDVEEASRRGIVVCNTPHENAVSTAEHTFALMLGLARKVLPAHESTRKGAWDRYRFVGTELFQKTLGVLGLGKVGFRLTMRAKAFGMRILAFDKYVSASQPAATETGAELRNLPSVLNQADFITNHLPMTDQTHQLLDYSQFQQMKPTAFFINAARGKTVDESGLIQALQQNIIAGAALDVRANEPPEESALNQMDNVILTPHIAAWTEEAQRKVLDTVTKDVDRVLQGKPAANYVNFGLPQRGYT